MISNNDLPHKPDTLQQTLLINKRSNRSWRVFSILSVIINLPIVGLIITGLIFGGLLYKRPDYMLASFVQSMMNMSPFLLPLAIVDFIAIRSYTKKQSPPWKAFFTSLLAINIIYFLIARWALTQPSAGVAGIAVIFIAYVLLILDLIIILLFLTLTKPVPGQD